MIITLGGASVQIDSEVICYECERVFDLMDEDDACEWYYGHDCEVEA